MKAMVSGGAGFIGGHVSERLIKGGWEVVAVDNLSLGNERNVQRISADPKFELVRIDASDIDSVNEVMKDVDFVFHLAANSDIKMGGTNPNMDLNNTFMTTVSILESMRQNDVKKLFFASTSAIYGDIPGELSELTGGLKPISYYGAAKLSSEAFISAYSYMNDIDSLILRFPNVVGPGLTHGVIFDFIDKLKRDPTKLEILGDGKQSKQYIHTEDLVNGIDMLTKELEKGVNVYNISTESSTTVKEIADIVCSRMGLDNVKYEYTEGAAGWKGDVPVFKYDISKIKRTGWMYRYSSTEAVKKTVSEMPK